MPKNKISQKKLDFSNERIYVGIDVHQKRWSLSLYCGDQYLKTYSQDADADLLIHHLKKNYPGATYHCGL